MQGENTNLPTQRYMQDKIDLSNSRCNSPRQGIQLFGHYYHELARAHLSAYSTKSQKPQK